MKNLPVLIITIIILKFNNVNAQKSSVYLHFGPSFPVGDFASVEDQNNAGFAKTGFLYELGYSFDFAKHWGAEFKLMSSSNGVDEDEIVKILNSDNTQGYSFNVDFDSYNSALYLIGAHYIFPFEKSAVKIQLLLGTMGMSSTNNLIKISNPILGYAEVSNRTDYSNAFAACFGFQYQYNITPVFGIDVNYESIASELPFTGTTSASGMSAEFSTGNQKVQFVSLGAGVHFAF